MTRWSCAVSILLAGWASGCSCGDDDDDTRGRLAELAEIGEEGDTFALGELVGVVPAGAVEAGGTVVVRGMVREDVPSPPGGVGPVYELELDREIREPITLELPYDPAALEGRSPLGLRVASSPDGIAWGCDPMTAPRAESTSVLAVVSHLSFWTLRYLPCEGANDCDLPERCIDPGPNGYCATPCANDGDCPSPTYCLCGICSRDSCEQPANDCPTRTHCSVDEADQRGVCLPECTPLDRCGLPEEQQLCSPGGRCAFQQSALCPDRFACADDHTCSHSWCVPTDTTGCECGVDEGCACETPEDCPDDGTEHETCDNAADDDGDGDIDCVDVDCADEPGCTAGLPEDCAAAGDEDGDGDADCLDTDCVGHPACAVAPITFQDPELEDADWAVEEEQTSGPISATYRRELAGGNPDAHRAMTHDFEDDDGAESIRTFQRYVPATYDPGAEGAIESLDFGIDVRTDRQIGNGFLVFQAGAHFRAAYALHDPAGETWQPHVVTGLTEADFLADDGVTTPDFSAAGAPLAFGFMRASSSTPPTPQFSNDHGADNFAVTIYRRPVLPAEDCDNGADDDGDNLVDCADGDCDEDPACAPREDCDNAADDDGDALVDCADGDCNADPGCAAGPWPIELTTLGNRPNAFSRHAPQNADWVAFQDGDGPWVELVGDAGVYDALVTDPDGRYAVAIACVEGWVQVLYAVATQGGVLTLVGCSAGADPFGSFVSGDLVGADDCTTVAVGHVGNRNLCGTAGWGPALIPDGTYDLIAVTGPTDQASVRGLIVRDVVVAGNTTLDADFTGPDAFDLVEGDLGDADTEVWLATRRGGFLITMAGVPLTYGGVPAAQLLENEGHSATIRGADAGSTVNVFFREPIDLALGVEAPPLPPVTGVRLADEPYALYAADLEFIPAGTEAVALSLPGGGGGGWWVVLATTAWLDGARRIETPDLSGAPGWPVGLTTNPDASGTLGLLAPAPGDVLECLGAFPGYARDGLRCPGRTGSPFGF